MSEQKSDDPNEPKTGGAATPADSTPRPPDPEPPALVPGRAAERTLAEVASAAVGSLRYWARVGLKWLEEGAEAEAAAVLEAHLWARSRAAGGNRA